VPEIRGFESPGLGPYAASLANRHSRWECRPDRRCSTRQRNINQGMDCPLSHSRQACRWLRLQPDGLYPAGQPATDGLLDPRTAVAEQRGACLGAEHSHRSHQSAVTFVRQLRQRHTEVRIFTGNFDYLVQVRPKKVVASCLIANQRASGGGRCFPLQQPIAFGRAAWLASGPGECSYSGLSSAVCLLALSCPSRVQQ
jgi:hypothetical protein